MYLAKCFIYTLKSNLVKIFTDENLLVYGVYNCNKLCVLCSWSAEPWKTVIIIKVGNTTIVIYIKHHHSYLQVISYP